MKRMLSWLLVCALLMCLLPAVVAMADTNEVVLRFVVASDIHLTESSTDNPSNQFRGMFQSAYAYAATQSYTSVDAFVLVGDIVCEGTVAEYAVFQDIMASADLADNTEVLTVMGNHEWWRYANNSVLELGDTSYLNGIAAVDAIPEKGLNWSRDIKGFRFVGMSQLSDDTYGEDNINWMAGEIAEAVSADDTKPVFTFQHHPVRGTVMASNLPSSMKQADSDLLDPVYGAYRQVINFSGHSHIPVNTPTAINQTTYTQYTCGTMGTIGSDGMGTYAGVLPNRDRVGQYTIVEVYADHSLRMVPYDEYTDSWFANLNGDGGTIEYTVDVNDPDNWLYKPETRADQYEAPYFEAGTAVTASDITDETLRLSFAQAKDNNGVYGYDIVCTAADSQKSYRFYSEWYLQPMPTSVSYQLVGLESETAYSVAVYPLDFFDNKGEPITCSVTTEAAPEVDDEIVYEPEAYTTNLVPYGNAETLDTTDWGLFRNTSFTQEQVHGGSYALKLHNTGAQAQVQINLRGIVPLSYYKISAWVYVEAGAQPTIQRSLIAAVESPWSTLASSYAVVPATAGQWVPYEFTFQAPAKTNLFQIAFYTADANTYFYLDDVEIYRMCSHTYTNYVEKTLSDGTPVTYWECRTCGKYFADEDCTVEFTPPTDPGAVGALTYVNVTENAENGSLFVNGTFDTTGAEVTGWASTTTLGPASASDATVDSENIATANYTDFDVITVGTKPTGWSVHTADTLAVAQLTADNRVLQASLKSTDYFWYYGQYTTLDSTKAHAVICRMKTTEDNTANVKLYWRNGTEIPVFTLTDEWAEYRVDIPANPTDGDNYILQWEPQSTEGTFYIDDLQIVEVTAKTSEQYTALKTLDFNSQSSGGWNGLAANTTWTTGASGESGDYALAYTKAANADPSINYYNMTITEGQQYRLTFDAKSDGNALTMYSYFHGQYTASKSFYALTDEWTTYHSTVFTSTLSGTGNDNSKFFLQFSDAAQSGVAYIDNIRIELVTEQPVSAYSDGYGTLGGTESSNVFAMKELQKLWNTATGANLTAGMDYTLLFDIRAEADAAMTVGVGVDNGTDSSSASVSVAANGAWQTVSFDFTAAETDVAATEIWVSREGEGTLYLDNFRLYKNREAVLPRDTLLTNGNTLAGWDGGTTIRCFSGVGSKGSQFTQTVVGGLDAAQSYVVNFRADVTNTRQLSLTLGGTEVWSDDLSAVTGWKDFTCVIVPTNSSGPLVISSVDGAEISLDDVTVYAKHALGDVNTDGEVDIFDAILYKRGFADESLFKTDVFADMTGTANGVNYNREGIVIDLADLLALRKWLLENLSL